MEFVHERREHDFEGGLTVNAALPNIRLHLLIAVFCADVTLRCQEELNFLVSCAEDGGKF